jgi:hypothetical protein
MILASTRVVCNLSKVLVSELVIAASGTTRIATSATGVASATLRIAAATTAAKNSPENLSEDIVLTRKSNSRYVC